MSLPQLFAFLLVVSSLCSVFSGCGKDDDALPADDCQGMEVYEALINIPPWSGSLYTARLKGDCLEVVHYCCNCTSVRARAQRSALTVYPPIYVVGVNVVENPGTQCVWAGRDSIVFSLADIRRRDKEFDLRFEGLDDLVIEVR